MLANRMWMTPICLLAIETAVHIAQSRRTVNKNPELYQCATTIDDKKKALIAGGI